MSINIQPTPEHQALASAVNARMAADSRIVNAKAALLRLAGVGAVMALTGVGAAAAMFGYSFIKDERSSADKIADSLVRALDRTTLKTSGEVRMATDARVKLDSETLKLEPGATVRVDGPLKLEPEATVKLDPKATVKVTGGGETARPTDRQLQPDAKPPSGGPAVTNFTIFKSVKFGQGSVVTGWKFSTNEQAAPSEQYCYFTESTGTGNEQRTVNLANNGVTLPAPRSQSFDAGQAAMSCIWFDTKAGRGL
jgi:hypothetical protein